MGPTRSVASKPSPAQQNKTNAQQGRCSR
jgi:hypothetical protein